MNLNSTFSAGFRHESALSEFGNIDFQINASGADWNGMEFNDSYANISVRNDSLQVKQHFVRSDDIALETSLSGKMSRGKLEMAINEFMVGSPDYNWRAENRPLITYTEDNRLTLDRFRLTSDNDLVEINGTFSSSHEDSVQYRLENFDLSRVSDLIGGRITFSGITNGDFVTRSLLDAPTIQGQIEVDNGRILDRVIGDVSLNSVYNPDEDRFDTDLLIYTDPEKYGDYLEENDGNGHDLRFTGYFKVPEYEEDDFLYFDADLRQIDMWIVTFIAPVVVIDMEGSSSGTGFVRASPSDYDFEGTFDITDVYGVPFFTNVGYNLNGELIFNREDGLLFNDIRLEDRNGGTGTLFGQVDLDDFSPESFLDLTLDMNNLEFMNNPPDPDVPFYSNLYGTGQARITGSNFSPFLRSVSTINLTSDSRISIPLEEEIEFEQDRRFIQFVDSFDLSLLEQRSRERDEAGGNGNGEEEELTFIERFTMDLSFAANDPINVRLIFDPVTNEILNSNGTGQMRLLLEDQDLSMFGRYNIQSGDYQFVSGDIFTRRFTLQEGGSISWQGDLIDAGLNVTAVYRARPNISSLLSTQAAAQQDTGQRIPVELVLQIGGTITEVENDFFFRVPTGVEGTLDPTIATQINNLNQNEELKLIQATSILLSGNFLPYSDAQGLGLGEGITGTSAVVNPLLSSQVINPLLSDQINSLLRSDITFDIDLNLTAFNEVDLGVALRLFDDRVILRREGQITGEQSDIGDLGATYRINRIFSLTAFHRQDPTLSYTSGVETRQSQQMNGMGLEAQVQFNTWQGFRQRMSAAIRGMFGLRRDDDESESEREAEEPATVAGNQNIIRIENISIDE
ncbi:MAG: translocation/assembly module TamB domain-containing protein [Balneolaceae bacterium]|nr:translocation/assembly module TamB domain-containing protein [Balneolaceae bacterium]